MSAEWPAWVQAIGSVAAIGVAVWLSRAQSQNALQLQREDRRQALSGLGNTVLVLANNCASSIKFYVSELGNRDAIYEVAEGERYFDFDGLQSLETMISVIPLHNLPSELVTHMMVLHSVLRQFRGQLDMALRLYRKMDGSAFEDLFSAFQQMDDVAQKTVEGMRAEVARIEAS